MITGKDETWDTTDMTEYCALAVHSREQYGYLNRLIKDVKDGNGRMGVEELRAPIVGW